MNPSSSSRGSLWRFWPLAVFLAMVGIACLLVIEVTGFFRLSRDARCLRDSLTDLRSAASPAWHKRFELRVGAITCALVRTGLHFAPLDADARLALDSVRGGEAGIYEDHGRVRWSDRTALLSNADSAMEQRGWERLVRVAQKDDL